MPRSQKSNRRRSTIVKVKNKPKGIGKAVGKRVGRSQRFQGSALDYNEKESQFSNYARLGLMADANQIGAVKETITGFKPIKHVPAATGGAAAAVGSTAGVKDSETACSSPVCLSSDPGTTCFVRVCGNGVHSRSGTIGDGFTAQSLN